MITHSARFLPKLFTKVLPRLAQPSLKIPPDGVYAWSLLPAIRHTCEPRPGQGMARPETDRYHLNAIRIDALPSICEVGYVRHPVKIAQRRQGRPHGRKHQGSQRLGPTPQGRGNRPPAGLAERSEDRPGPQLPL